MGFSLKKLVRGVAKIGRPLVLQALKSTPLGLAAAKVASVAKSLGVSRKEMSIRKVQPLSVRAPIERTVLSMPVSGPLLPGPEGLVKAPRKARRPKITDRTMTVAQMQRELKRAKKGTDIWTQADKRAAKKRAGGTRRAPKGGLDLKAMAAAWRAAGKPGTWRDWIKTNQVRKAS